MFTKNEYMEELGFESAIAKKEKNKPKEISIITRLDHRYDNFPHPPLYVKGPPPQPPTEACLSARDKAINALRLTCKHIVKNI